MVIYGTMRTCRALHSVSVKAISTVQPRVTPCPATAPPPPPPSSDTPPPTPPSTLLYPLILPSCCRERGYGTHLRLVQYTRLIKSIKREREVAASWTMAIVPMAIVCTPLYTLLYTPLYIPLYILLVAAMAMATAIVVATILIAPLPSTSLLTFLSLRSFLTFTYALALPALLALPLSAIAPSIPYLLLCYSITAVVVCAPYMRSCRGWCF